jgi:hypothetical protein
MRLLTKILSACGEVADRRADGGGTPSKALLSLASPLHRFTVPLPINGEDF